MHLPLLFSILVLGSVAQSGISSFEVRNGKTKLLGNSFGVPGKQATYDYIVVGAGTGGNTVAARLALAGFSVAVIEAGSFYELDNGNRTTVPGYDQTTHPNTNATSLVEYDFITEPQGGLNGRKLHYSQGRTFGGTSALNLMGYQRGTKGSFEVWADLVGSPLWKWENVLPFYQASATFSPPNSSYINPNIHPIPYDPAAFNNFMNGPLHVSYGNNQGEYGPAIAKGFENMGLKLIDGLNSGILIGYAPMTSTVNPQAATRDSSKSSFLELAMYETDIKIYQTTIAKKIIFDTKKKATGVLVESQGGIKALYTLNATKEIIVSAGAFRSPQLLMLSGVGPKEILESFDIPEVSVLPGVGQGIQDQAWLGFNYGVNQTTKTQLVAGNPAYTVPAVEQYLNNQSGPLAGIGAAEYTGWEKLPAANRANLSPAAIAHLDSYPSDWPDMEYQEIAFAATPPNISDTASYMTFGGCIMVPKARGNMTIKSADMDDYPVISPNWLDDPVDQEIAVEAFKRNRDWARGTGMLIDEFDPPASIQSDDDILTWVRAEATFIYHASSACAMGKDDNPMAVLDGEARVRGVTGLRVVDSSAMPVLVPGHPMSTIYMLAEKIANAIIKGKLE
ncbi:hypothetical protein BGZ60DRAFT_424890 [Tricladium varicosporioides]|nr:hypothetical protein BGZ60DRAFT_424890 [Hymenoscyphus varicosporioides]